VTLGGRRVAVKRPRARTADGESEVPLLTYEHFAARDQLGRVVLERMLGGVWTRQYRRAQEPVGEEIAAGERSTSKSAVSRALVERTREALWALMSRPLVDVRLAVMMIDGIELHGRTNIVALGISTAGEMLALGLWEGSTENATVAAALLSDLVDRGLDVEQGMLFIIDGSKALRTRARPKCPRAAVAAPIAGVETVAASVRSGTARASRPSSCCSSRCGILAAAPGSGGDDQVPRHGRAVPAFVGTGYCANLPSSRCSHSPVSANSLRPPDVQGGPACRR
jgi:hypothetical protein